LSFDSENLSVERTDRPESFKQRNWQTRYRSTTSNVLHDFYIPALRCATRYDRVAGYFRSTSLAAASQGFSALARHQGRVRLVAGADLDPKDAQVILDHEDGGHLAQALLSALADPLAWPEPVDNGLGLLAWMLKAGCLEIRVALRRHRKTGAAIPFESREDGYVHEKWAIFTDAECNRLIAEGSLNESRTALLINAENIGVHCDWWGPQDAARADLYAADFETIWDNQDPGLYVVDLPQAVRERLIEIAGSVANPKEIDGSSELPVEARRPTAREWLELAILRDAPRMPKGRLVGMVTAPVEPWPHQAVVARRLIDAFPYSFLLCDEVGLGKTIEAGLALRSLILSGLAKRVLIAPPASLARQWQSELASKFLLRFARAVTGAQTRHEYLHPTSEQVPAKYVFAPDQVIVSTGLVRRKDRQRELSAQAWDIALVDEAHYARRSNSTAGTVVQPKYGDLYRAVSESLRPKVRSLWLATATPMQLDPIEVFDLFRLMRRVGPFQEDPTLTQAYYEVQGRIQRGERVSDEDLAFLRQVLHSIQRHDPELAQFIRQTVLNPSNRTQYDNWLNKGIKPTAASLKQLLRAIFASAPLSRVMMRHNRALLRVYQEQGRLNANLAHRHVLPMRRIQYTTQEQAAYEALKSYSDELAQQIASANDQQARVSTGFYLSFLQRRFASSLHAIGETLRRRRERVKLTLDHLLDKPGGHPSAAVAELVHLNEDMEQEEGDAEVIEQLLKNRSAEDLRWEFDKLSGMLAGSLYDAEPASSKTQALLGYVDQRPDPTRPGRVRQTVIFTQFWDTLEDLVRRLRQADARLLVGTYSGRGGQYTHPETGKLVGTERDEIKHRFLRGQIDILVCTDAAAEGLNLQTADFLVNFDLPWNPAKVEQRIGRIDRIGQLHEDIYVQNLCYLGSVEEIVYDRLLNRLGSMIAVVGDQQVSMLPVTEEDFRRLAEGEVSEAELEAEARQRIALSQHRVRETELTGKEVYEIYQRLEQAHAQERLPVTLDGIWAVLTGSAYLKALGCAVAANLTGDQREPLLIHGLPGVADGTALTTDRRLFDEGIESLGQRLRFASYGESVFDAILELGAGWDAPSCVRRIAVRPKGLALEYVAYVAATKDTEGGALRLVTDLGGLAGLDLDESATVCEADAEPFLARLQALADAEFRLTTHVANVEADNQQSGRAQAALALGTAYGFIAGRQKLGSADANFWKELDACRRLVAERTAQGGVFTVHRVPNVYDQVATAFVPFDVRRKISDDSFWVDSASAPLLNAALDAAARVADGIKKKKAELTTDLALSRIVAEMKRVLS
jgi:superfamily II DNA or RNA helicase